jgi:ribosomal-protein-alanine N-acetyltransferase
MLHTTRLIIRQLTMDDLEAFHQIWGDPDVIFWGAMHDLDGSRILLQGLLKRRLDGIDESGWFGVFRRADMQFVGNVVIEPAS